MKGVKAMLKKQEMNYLLLLEKKLIAVDAMILMENAKVA